MTRKEDYQGALGIDRLKDHYKHCIRLSASNKINPKNAFDLQLIDYMHDIVSNAEDGPINFKIVSSALDVGAKIYSNRVDRIQSEAQKVASSILMALDGHQVTREEEVDDEANVSGSSDCIEGEEGIGHSREKKKISRKKNVKTVVQDEDSLNAKLDKIILGDPFLDGLSRDFDMSCPAALICYNALTQPNCLLTIESNNLRNNYMEHENPTISETHNSVTLVTKRTNCAQIIRDNQGNPICPRLENFLFRDRTTNIIKPDAGGIHEFNPEHYQEPDDCGDDHIGDVCSVMGDNDVNESDDLIPDLNEIAASRPTEYGYDNHRLLNTWAGPYGWKILKPKKDPPKSTKKRTRTEPVPINFSEPANSIDSANFSDKIGRFSSDQVKKWKLTRKNGLLTQDHNLDEDITRKKIITSFLRPEDTYHVKTPLEALKVEGDQVSEDGDYASPAMGDFDLAMDDLDSQADDFSNIQMDFAGENLVDQPFEVAEVNIHFAKSAKRMDIKKLKRVIWDSMATPEVDFKDLYCGLPSKLTTRMATDLSEPIAFVTLLHLANEKNLELIAGQNFRDFIIKQV